MPRTSTRRAPAKVNLALHVTGRRDDGYHVLGSLVVFADVWDVVTLSEAPARSLRITGPLAAGVPDDDRNLAWRAADRFAALRGGVPEVSITLQKHLPHGGGIGGGSSDAAATIRALAALAGAPVLDPAEALPMGADVPVCLAAPTPVVMTGIGEHLAPAPALPPAWLVLAHPGTPVPTGAVFAAAATASSGRFGGSLPAVPDGMDFAALTGWLSEQRNDLETAAMSIAPAIAGLKRDMARQPGCALARMSGSGSTVFGLFPDEVSAGNAAHGLAQPGRWVRAARMLAAQDAL